MNCAASLMGIDQRVVYDLPRMQQPRQMPSIARIGLDPIPLLTLQVRRCRDRTIDSRRQQRMFGCLGDTLHRSKENLHLQGACKLPKYTRSRCAGY